VDRQFFALLVGACAVVPIVSWFSTFSMRIGFLAGVAYLIAFYVVDVITVRLIPDKSEVVKDSKHDV
jgi:hypothetical protein